MFCTAIANIQTKLVSTLEITPGAFKSLFITRVLRETWHLLNLAGNTQIRTTVDKMHWFFKSHFAAHHPQQQVYLKED